MKKRLLPAFLALAMLLTLLPMSALAAEGESKASVTGYGFIWDASAKELDLVEGATTSGDWMDETMYVYFSTAPDQGTNLWFQISVGEDAWGCAASGGSKTYAFSFLNRGTQWELHPTIENESFSYNGQNVVHAENYMQDKASVTLKVFTPAEAISGEQESAPEAEVLGTAIFEKTFTLTKGTVLKEVVEDEPAAVAVVPANLTAAVGAEAPAYGHAKTYTAVLTGKAIAVAATELEKTAAGNPNATGGADDEEVTDYWVGVGLSKQADATYAWGFGTKPADLDDSAYKSVTRTQTTGGKEYVTMYWSPDTGKTWTNDGSKTGYISVKTGKTVTDYTVTFDVAIKTVIAPEPEEDGSLKPSEDAVKDIIASQIDANEVKITVEAPKGDEPETDTIPAKTTVPLNTDALTALENVAKPLVIETPKGGVSVDASTLIGKTGTGDTVNFVMADTTANDAEEGTQAFTVGFFKGENEIEVKDLSTAKKLTLTFKTIFEKDQTVTITSGDSTYEATVEEGGVVTVETTHLSEWTIALKAAETDKITVSFDANGFLGGAVTLNNLTADKFYVIQLTRAAGANTVKVAFIHTAANTSLTFAAQQGSTLEVWELDSSPTTDNDLVGHKVVDSWTIAPTPAN